jgi:hypothetical protein
MYNTSETEQSWDLIITPRKKWWDLLLLIVLLVSLVGIASQIIPGFYNRPFADDFCTAASVRSQPFGQYFLDEYNGWTGRYSYILITGFATLVGTELFAILPGLLALAWLLAITWCLLPLINYAQLSSPLLAAIAASGLFLCLIFNTLPKFFESSIWVIGSINYELPMILFTVQVGLFLRSWFSKRPAPFALVILLSFLSGGFSEIFGLLQITLFGLVILFLFFSKQSSKQKEFTTNLLVGLFTAIIAFIIVYIAPGNAVRQAASHHLNPTSFTQLPRQLLYGTLVEGYLFVIFARFWLLPIFLLPFALSLTNLPVAESTERIWQSNSDNPKKYFQNILLISGLTVFLAIMAALPSAYIQSEPPVSRAMILVFPFFILAIQVVMFKTGRYVSRRNKSFNNKAREIVLYLALFTLFFCTVLGVWQFSSLLPIQKDYASNWDSRDRELKSFAVEGVEQVQTNALRNAYGYTDLDVNPKNWVNRCVAAYYGLQSIEATGVSIP